VPPAPTWPQGGGRRQYGDREALATIILVATVGSPWRHCLRRSVRPGRPRTVASPGGLTPPVPRAVRS
jgi:hypothetical protein